MTFEVPKLNRPKLIRDPIHDLIRIDDCCIQQLLDSEPMQRLRRIRQLGTASLVFPAAEHSRFTHSLGVYHLAVRMLDQLSIFDEEERIVVKIAALLHDVGHGPFSHLFEDICKNYLNGNAYKDHEKWTYSIITEHGQVSSIVSSLGNDVRNQVASIFHGDLKVRDVLKKIVSSQLDADRLDYMLRDSYMTGVWYGRFDLEWVLRNLFIKKGSLIELDGTSSPESDHLAVETRRGLSSLENFLIGNLHLYQNVYHHKTVLASNALLEGILKRAMDIFQESPRAIVLPAALAKIAMNEAVSLDEYLELDEFEVLSCASRWSKNSEDGVLRDLSGRFQNRRLFKITYLPKENWKKSAELAGAIKEMVRSKQLDPRYYYFEPDPKRDAYKFASKEEIVVVDRDGLLRKYSQIGNSNSGGAVSEAIPKAAINRSAVVYPPEIHDDVKKLVGEG